MSDYYGKATLEDWLAEEVFMDGFVPKEVVELFEEWREGVEADISNWMDSDDGNGNTLSWRGWGKGFNSIPDEDDEAFEKAEVLGKKILGGTREQTDKNYS